MPNAVEAVGEAVDQKTPDELVRSKRHHPWRIAASVVAPAERNGRVIGADQAAVSDGDAVRVTTAIGEDMFE